MSGPRVRGLPVGQARGKIILRLSGRVRRGYRFGLLRNCRRWEIWRYRAVSIDCIGSADSSREYLQDAKTVAGTIRALAVCSDQTAGYSPRREDVIDTFSNPTADNSNVSASEVKGKVTTDSDEIADWIVDSKRVQTA